MTTPSLNASSGDVRNLLVELVCEELCGQGHNTMTGVVTFLEPAEYDKLNLDKPYPSAPAFTMSCPWSHSPCRRVLGRVVARISVSPWGGTRTNETSNDRYYRFERRHGTFTRTIGLPQGVSEDGISADYKNGVLEIHAAKPEQTKPRRIQVGSAEQATIEGEASQK